MSSLGTIAGRSHKSTSRATKWHLNTDAVPEGLSKIWVYCPSYDFMRVRQTNPHMLNYCLDATHWCEVIEGEPRPEPPFKG